MKLLMKMAGFLSWQRCSTVYPASLAKHPQTWTKEEIGAWLRWCSEEYSIEPIPPEKFDLNGKALCLLSRSDFMERVPRNGDVLYNCLQSLITKHTGSGVLYQQSSANTSSSRDVYQPHSGDQMSSTSSISDHMTPAGYLLVPSSSSVSQPASIPLTTVPCTVQSSVSRTSFVPIKPHPYISIPVRHQQGETTATLVRPSVHLGDPVFHGPSSLLGEQSHGNGHSLDPHRPDRSSDCRLLWEFIYQLLSNKKYSNYVCWEDQEEYVFRIINPTGLAELWGQQKNRTNMTYEKLSRALRYYYRMNIIKKVQGKRLTYRFLQSPLSIQKGQRGAKPHYKLQMDLMSSQSSQQSAQNDPDSSKPGSTAVISGHMTPLREETKNESDTEENDSDTAIPELWRESASSRSSKSNRSTPAYRMLLDVEHQSKEQESASDKLPQTKISEVSPAYSSLNLYQHGAKHSSYIPIPTFSEGRYLPIVKHEHFYTSPHTMTTESYFQHPRQPLSSLSPMEIKPEQERLDVLDMRPYGRNIRYPENMYRSLSSDFAQSLKVRPFAFRPSQPRSASPRCDVQQEPEDLSTKKGARSEKTSGEESFRPGSSFSPIKLIESVSSGSQNRSDLYTSGPRDRSDIYTSGSRDRPDLYTSASRDESESYTFCSREGPGASSFSSRDSSNTSSSQDKSDRNIRFSRESRKAKLESSPEPDDNL